MTLFVPSIFLATALLSMCGDIGFQHDPPPPTFCDRGDLWDVRSMLRLVIDTNSPDKDTQAIRPDAEALDRNLRNHYMGGGPSSPENRASFQRFRDFVKKKCGGDKAIPKNLSDLYSR